MNNREKGAQFESVASEYFLEKNYQILERNYSRKVGEIDLIVKDPNGTLVFVEVKYRRKQKKGFPMEAVNVKKQQRIYRTAQWYLLEHPISSHISCRFDVISILDGEVTHYVNAFGGF